MGAMLSDHAARAQRVAVLAVLVAAGSASAQLSFSDRTDEVGVTATHWMADYQGMTLMMSGGGAIGDFNKDGWPDLFFPVGGGEPDKLFINQGSGPQWFVDEAASWGIAVSHRSMGSAVGDFNNDGWDDIFVVSQGDVSDVLGPGKHKLYQNNGDGTFTDVAVAAGVNWASTNTDGTGAAWGDYDLDGHLDLFVCSWFETNPDGNRLFHNNGDGTFTDVTDTGVFDTSTAMLRGFTPIFADMDGDRYPELLLVNDWETSRYFVNNGDGTFTDHTVSAGINKDCNGMGTWVADIDGDGDLDWYITNILRDPFGVPFCGNVLYRNDGGHVYTEVGEALGIRDGGFGWGSQAVDFDNDSDLDVVEHSGMMGHNNLEPVMLWLQKANSGTFTERAAERGLVHQDNGRGLAHVDYDRDGDVDVVLFNNATLGNGALKLFRNDLSVESGSTNYLRISLDTGTHPCLAPNGYGTKVVCIAGGKEQLRYMYGGYTCFSQGEMTLHYGLRNRPTADVEISWADGTMTVIEDVAANQQITVQAQHPIDFVFDGVIDALDQAAFLALFAANDLAADLTGNGKVNTKDMNLFNDLYANPCQ